MTIKELRQHKGWSQQELASRAGVSISSVVRAERGTSSNKSTLRLLAQALGVDVEELSRESRPISH